MKPAVIILVVVLTALSVQAASHHRKHNVKGGGQSPTKGGLSGGNDGNSLPIFDIENNGGGDVEWPQPGRINNFEVPDAFKEDTKNSAAASSRHGKSKHRSHAN